MSVRPIHFCACGDHAFVALTRGYMTMVSPQDAFLLDMLPFGARVGLTGYAYAATSPKCPNGGYLHRLVMRAGPGDQQVDHISGDRMDNRRSNLRLCTRSENQQNQRAQKRDLPKGVTKEPAGTFRAQIKANGKKFNLGSYATPEAAHAVYVAAAREHFGQFARAA